MANGRSIAGKLCATPEVIAGARWATGGGQRSTPALPALLPTGIALFVSSKFATTVGGDFASGRLYQWLGCTGERMLASSSQNAPASGRLFPTSGTRANVVPRGVHR